MKLSNGNENLSSSRHLTGKWIVRNGSQAVNLAEMLICGKGARKTVPEAEGFSIIGLKASTLLPNDGDNTEFSMPLAPAPMVYHQIHSANETLEYALPFELFASDAQEAVDHCLIAHRIAALAAQPGLCSIDPSTAGTLECVSLPTQDAIDAIQSTADIRPQNTANNAEDNLISIIQESFAYFAKFGISRDLTTCWNDENSELCIVTAGQMVKKARKAANILNSCHIPCSVMKITLLTPFPKQKALETLKNKKRILVIGDYTSSEQSSLFSSVCESLYGFESKPHVRYLYGYDHDFIDRLAEWAQADSALIAKAFIHAGDTDNTGLVIGAAPSGDMGMGLLMDVASYICKQNHLHAIAAQTDHKLVCAMKLGINPTALATEKTDILFLSHPGLIDLEHILDCVKPGGILLIQGRSIDDKSFWPLFSQEQKSFIEQNALEVYGISGNLVGEYSTDDTYGSFIIHGAILALYAQKTGDRDNCLLEKLASDASLDKCEISKILDGYKAINKVDRTINYKNVYDPYFQPQLHLPYMQPAASRSEDNMDWRIAIRNFYITGRGNYALNHPLPALSIRPAVLNPYLEHIEQHRHYPMILYPGTPGKCRKCESLDAFLCPTEENETRWLELVDRFVRFMSEKMIGEKGKLPANSCIIQFLPAFCATLDKNDQSFFYNRMEKRLGQLDASAELIGLNEYTLLNLYVDAVRASRRNRMRDVMMEVRLLITRLREAVRIDDDYGPQASTQTALSSSLGEIGGEFFNTSELAEHLSHQPRGHKLYDPVRIKRMRETLKTLEDFFKTLDNSLDLLLIHGGTLPENCTFDKVQIIRHPDALQVASAIFDALAENMVQVFKAMRIARLDVSGAYDEELHGGILDQFSWQDLNPDELQLFPVVCICESTDALYSKLAQFSKIMRSGKPLDVIALEPASTSIIDHAEPRMLSYNPGFSYLSTAYRETFVAQATLARPELLARTFHKMNTSLRPAVTVVSVPVWNWRLPADVQLETALLGRVAPIFEYNPDAGKTRQERFTIQDNPEPDAVWPSTDVPYIDENGNHAVMHTAFTFAHALAIEPGYHQYFRILPNEAWPSETWNDELIEIDEFLRNPTFDTPKIPFIWGVIDGYLRKCILTRDVTNACIDRMQRWATLRDLCMTDSAQDQPHSQIEANRPPVPPADTTDTAIIRSQAVAETIGAFKTEFETLCQNLQKQLSAKETKENFETQENEPVSSDESTPVQTETQTVTESAKESYTSQTAVPAPGPKIPYINAAQCIACGACVALNDTLFRLNDNMQAEIIDPDAGSQQDLELAAENCPVGCIIIK